MPDSPSADFSFSDTIGSLWGGLKPIVSQGVSTWGQIEVARLQADAQAKLNALKTQNNTLGPNDPAAAQKYADKTLAQQFLPPGNAGALVSSLLPFVIIGLGLLLIVFIFKRAFAK